MAMPQSAVQTIDADAHLVESAETWEHYDQSSTRQSKADQALFPADLGGQLDNAIVPAIADPYNDPHSERWFIAGHVRGKRMPSSLPGIPDVNDPQARLSWMDAHGISVQVLYPTIFMEQVANRPHVEAPIVWAYAEWASRICKAGGDRLRWVSPVSITSIPDAVAQIRFGKENGACGVLLPPIHGDLLLEEVYFFPIYEEAARLDLPICIHAGNANPAMTELLGQDNPGATFWQYKVSLMAAFQTFLTSDIPHQYPNLRTGFLGAGAQGIIYPLGEWSRRLRADNPEKNSNALENRRLWVSLAGHDDIGYMVKRVGSDRLMAGTEFGHTSGASVMSALGKALDEEVITPETYEKIVWHNPRAFYGFSADAS